MNYKKIGLGVALLALLAGCSGHAEYNSFLAAEAAASRAAFAEGMAIQTTEGGRIALSITYALGVGKPAYQRDETIIDYSQVLLPWAQLILTGGWNFGEIDSSYKYNVEDQGTMVIYDSSFNSLTSESFNSREATYSEGSHNGAE